jgi:hypothetical protein
MAGDMMTLMAVMRGILIATSLIAAVFFARFFNKTRDRFFAWFAAAFALLTINWIGSALLDPHEESRKLIFVVRLAAFAMIIAAVIEKNRKRS